MKAIFRPGGWPVRVLLCVCMLCLFLVGAVSPAPLYPKQLTDAIGNAVRFLHPADFAVESSGVRARVAGYISDGQEARIYLLVEDLEKTRIDGEDMILMTERDYENLFSSERKPAISSTSVVGYDETTRSVLLELDYGIRSDQSESGPPEYGGVLDARLPVIGMMVGREEAHFNTKITLAEIQAREPVLVPRTDPPGWRLAEGGFEREFPELPWTRISNVCVMGNQCHILTLPTTTEGLFGNLWFYFEGETGGPLTTGSGVTIEGKEFERLLRVPEPTDLTDRAEYQLDVPPGDPEHIRLALRSFACKHYIEGDWLLEFPMEAAENVKKSSQALSVTGEDGAVYQIEGVYITPFKATLYGAYTYNGSDPNMPELRMVGKDGLPEISNYGENSYSGNRFTASVQFDTPRDTDDFIAVRFGEAEIPVA